MATRVLVYINSMHVNSSLSDIDGQSLDVKSKIISDQLLAVVSLVMKSAMYVGISAFGVLTNAVCLKVFWKMGFKETINISFFAIAVSDMGCLVFLLWMGVCYNPLFADSISTFDSRSVQYLTGGWPKFYFTRVSGVITAFVTFERCLCTTVPLKLKLFLTPMRVAVIHTLTYIIIAMSIVPMYLSTRLSWRWYPSRNASLVSLEFISNKETINNITNSLNVLLSNGSLVFVFVCTLLLILSLNESQRWKQKYTTSNDNSFNEGRASRRVVLIALLYIVCFLPGSLANLAMISYPEFNVGESQQNLFFFVYAFVHNIESISASINIFIYLKTSSKFRKIFLELFKCR